MLYETLAQPLLFLYFLILGFAGGIIFDICNFIKFLCANKKFACVLFDLIGSSACLFLIFFFNLKLCYGVLRVFPYLIFIISFCVERFTLGKFVAKFYTSCYNYLEKLKQRITRHKDETNKNG